MSQSEYTEFYRAHFRALEKPLSTMQFRVAGDIEFWALIFIPSTVPFELTRDMFWHGGRGLRLYLQREFIEKSERLIPRWLIFVQGVVNLEDLPLNAGWGPVQRSRTLKVIRKHLVRNALGFINNMRENERDQYDKFWINYGRYFKVGLVKDPDYKDELKRLVRFYSSKSGDSMTCLPDYVGRMKEGQGNIFFVTGEGKKAAEMAPAMERMNTKGYEVLYMIDLLDELCSLSIVDFGGRKLVDINKAGLHLDRTEDEKSKFEQRAKDCEELAAWLEQELGGRVQKVEIGERLVDSPAALVQGEWGMSPMMQRYMQSQTASGSQDSAFAVGSWDQAILEIGSEHRVFQRLRLTKDAAPELEINPEHPVIQKLRLMKDTAPDSEETKDMVILLYETAALKGGYNLEEPAEHAKRVTTLMATW
jgi:heat shock protein beta